MLYRVPMVLNKPWHIIAIIISIDTSWEHNTFDCINNQIQSPKISCWWWRLIPYLNLLLLCSISKNVYLYKIFTKLKANKLLFTLKVWYYLYCMKINNCICCKVKNFVTSDMFYLTIYKLESSDSLIEFGISFRNLNFII